MSSAVKKGRYWTLLNLLRGAGSVLDLLPKSKSFVPPEFPSDHEAIWKDWHAVGVDILGACKTFSSDKQVQLNVKISIANDKLETQCEEELFRELKVRFQSLVRKLEKMNPEQLRELKIAIMHSENEQDVHR